MHLSAAIRNYRLALLFALCCALPLPVMAEDPANAGNPKAPPAMSGDKAIQLQINKAIATLTKEWTNGKRNAADAAKLRVAADFFTDDNRGDITAEAIIKTLGQDLSEDPGESCYIKVELLSAIPGKLEDKLADQGLNLYRRAPHMIAYPETQQMVRQQLDQAINKIKLGDEAALQQLSDKFSEKKDTINEENKYIVLYHDELFNRLPFSALTIEAGWADYLDRVQATGSENNTAFFGVVSNATRAYSVAASADDLNSLIKGLTKIHSLKTPTIYKGASFDSTNKKNSWVVLKYGEAVGGDAMTALLKELTDRAAHPENTPKFKPPG